MHPKPEVVQFHDVLGEKLTAYLRNDTSRYFMLSASTGDGATDTSIRFSATHFIHKNASSKESKWISDLVTRVTGLNTGTGPLSINSYGPGGHFAAHGDSVRANCTFTAVVMELLTVQICTILERS